MSENEPFLLSCKPLKPEYSSLKKIQLTGDNFTLGRGKHCSALVPVVLISRTHCTFKKTSNNDWTIEDCSLCGISINGDRLGKGVVRKLAHEDIIEFEPTQEFMYKFVDPSSDVFDIPRKRIKLEPNEDIIKMKFEESQNYEMKHLEEKLYNTQQQKTTSKILKEQLQLDMNRKIQQLENDFAEQIENLKGEKDEVERQKATLIEERDAQLSIVKKEMEGKITELMDQIKKHNETETELLNENNLLKEKLMKEREEFMLELNRATSCKDELLKKLEAKAQEQEEARLKEKQQWEEQLRKETELLTLAKEQEIKELEEQRKQREEALMQELDTMKKNLEAQEQQTAQQRLQAAIQLNKQMEEMRKLSHEDQVKMEQLMKEREEIQKMLSEAELNAQKSIEEAKEKVKEREIELAAIAAERIQKEANQSNEVISSLQQQLEKLRDQLQIVETEKNTLLEALVVPDSGGEGSSKQAALAEVGELVENELQCSICAEQFIAATTLNCSHTFCKYCIAMWKKKKKDCPICRAPITSECRSLVIDSLIDTMVLNQPDEVKKRRQDLLKAREAEVIASTAVTPRVTPTTNHSRRRRNQRNTTTAATTAVATTTSATRTSTRTSTTTTTTTNIGVTSTSLTNRTAAAVAGGIPNQIPIVDLTHLPTPPPPPPPESRVPLRQVRIARGQPGQPIAFDRQQVFHIVQPNGQTVLVVAGPLGSSPASRAATGGATAAASTATTTATGHLAAPLGNSGNAPLQRP